MCDAAGEEVPGPGTGQLPRNAPGSLAKCRRCPAGCALVAEGPWPGVWVPAVPCAPRRVLGQQDGDAGSAVPAAEAEADAAAGACPWWTRSVAGRGRWSWGLAGLREAGLLQGVGRHVPPRLAMRPRRCARAAVRSPSRGWDADDAPRHVCRCESDCGRSRCGWGPTQWGRGLYQAGIQRAEGHRKWDCRRTGPRGATFPAGVLAAGGNKPERSPPGRAGGCRPRLSCFSFLGLVVRQSTHLESHSEVLSQITRSQFYCYTNTKVL